MKPLVSSSFTPQDIPKTPTLFLTYFGIYIVAVTLFGAWVSRRKQSGEDFLLGGRALPLYLTLGTTIATIIGTGLSLVIAIVVSILAAPSFRQRIYSGNSVGDIRKAF